MATSTELRTGAQRYAELLCRSNHTFLTGASHPDELVNQAKALGLSALALTDRDGLYGSMKAALAAQECGQKVIVGSELTFDDAPPLVLLAKNLAGYKNLCRLITRGRTAKPKGESSLPFSALAGHTEGLFALLRRPEEWAAARVKEVFGDSLFLAVTRHLCAGDERRLKVAVETSKALGVPLVAVNDVHTHDRARQPLQDVLTCIREKTTLSKAGRRLFGNAERTLKSPAEMAALFADLPEAIDNTVAIADACTFELSEIAYQFPEEDLPEGHTPTTWLRTLALDGAKDRYGREVPEAVVKQIDREIALIDDLKYPGYFLTLWSIVRFAREKKILCQGRGSAANSVVCYCLGITAIDPMRMDLLFERFMSRERNEPPDIDVDFEHERREEVLQHVYEKYGRERAGMVCEVITYRGRSAIRDVGKALGLSLDQVDRLARAIGGAVGELTPEMLVEVGLDPNDRTLRLALLLAGQIQGFPRHLGIHSGGFAITKGPLYELVPVENASMEGRTVVQWDKDDLAAAGILKVDLLSLGMLTAVAKALELIAESGDRLAPVNLLPPGEAANEAQAGLAAPAPEVDDRPRPPPARPALVAVDSSVPLTLPLFEEATQADGERGRRGAELAAFLRSAPEPLVIEERPAVADAPKAGEPPRPLSLFDIPSEDPATYAMLCDADSVGVFQVESRAQMAMLPRLAPKTFYDLVIEVAIIRPGPIIGNMVHPFLRRRDGLEPVQFPHPVFEPILTRTLGVPLFQEQVMRLAVAAAGFTLGEADALRRAMGHKRSHEKLLQLKERFLKGLEHLGLTREDGERVFKQFEGFAHYGFPESHSASFALIAYASAYLKRHHPAAFLAGLLNSQPMGFYAPHTLLEDGRRHGVPALAVDVQHSALDCTLERIPDGVPAPRDPLFAAHAPDLQPFAVRLGLRMVRGLHEQAAQRIARAREAGPFRSLYDLWRRTHVSKVDLARLAAADALRPLVEGSRREALWGVYALPEDEGDLFARVRPPPEAPPPLRPLSERERVLADYDSTSACIDAHPMGLMRSDLKAARILSSADLQNLRPGTRVTVAGMAIVRQRPETAKGMLFVTLEDEHGFANVVATPDVFERCRHAARGAPFLLVRGKIERAGKVINVKADTLEELVLGAKLPVTMRSFH